VIRREQRLDEASVILSRLYCFTGRHSDRRNSSTNQLEKNSLYERGELLAFSYPPLEASSEP
jgi:hypothetical protein